MSESHKKSFRPEHYSVCFVLTDPTGLVITLLIEVCCCGLVGLTAPWMVVGAASILDAVDVVHVPAKVVEDPAGGGNGSSCCRATIFTLRSNLC